MGSRSLSWAEAYGRMQAVGFQSVTGRLLYRIPQGKKVDEGETRFWHVVPDRWRVEDEQGVWHLHDGRRLLVRSGDQMQEMPANAAIYYGEGHPQELLGTRHEMGGRFSDTDDFSIPLGPGEQVEVAGRRAWEFRLAPPKRKPHPLAISIDDVTGAVLRMAIPEAGYLIEMAEFIPEADIADETFDWQGPISTDHLRQREEELAKRRWLEEQRFPSPRWWPAGFGYMACEGDPRTGSFYVALEVPGDPELARWPLKGKPPPHWKARSRRRHVHSWSDDRWYWALSVEEALSDADLAKVIASIPEIT